MALRVYLAVPIIGGRDLRSAQAIARVIEGLGYQVISEWVLAIDPGWSLAAEVVYLRDAQAIERCDILMAEVSVPSHGVGMEIMLAHTLKKAVLCLHRTGTEISRLLLGMPGIKIVEYSSFEELEEKLQLAL